MITADVYYTWIYILVSHMCGVLPMPGIKKVVSCVQEIPEA